MNILFVGNSFTFFFDIPMMFEELAKRAGEDVSADWVLRGGWTLEQYADENDEYGRKLSEKLKSGRKYDRVILQEQSHRPATDYEKFENGVRDVVRKVRKNNPEAKITLYATWGYADEFPFLAEHGWTSERMEELLREAYDRAASKFGLSVTHVGRAYLRLYRETALDPYWTDRKHPSVIGSCLSAYTLLFGQFPDLKEEDTEVMHMPELSDGKVIRRIAWETVHE